MLSLFGCNPIDIEDFADDEKEAIATAYIEDLRSGDFKAIRGSLEPSLQPQLTDEVLEQMRDLLSAGEVSSVDLIGYNAHTFNRDPTRYNLSYQYGFGDKWVLVNVAFRTLENGTHEIFGLNVYGPMNRSLQDVHRFTLSDKSPVHYLFLVGGIVTVLFVIATLVVVIRTKFQRRKWLWILFVLLGFGKFSLNWTTGQIGFSPLSIHLLSFGAVTASMYAPWILNVSLPIGAIVFWFKRARLKRENVQQVAAGNPPG